MLWKECKFVEERLRGIARLLDGEKMAGLCREFGIARKTGYKIYRRYKVCGIDGLTDRSRRSYRHANKLPTSIRTDNGAPFACGNALNGLSTLSVWCLCLGIDIEHIKSGHPEQNGRHERMHLMLKNETSKPASDNYRQQQARFDTFIDHYNQEWPYRALQLKVPATCTQNRPDPIRAWANSSIRSMTSPLLSPVATESVTNARK